MKKLYSLILILLWTFIGYAQVHILQDDLVDLPSDIHLKDGYMYFNQDEEFYRLDLSDPESNRELIAMLSGNPTTFQIIGDDLYYAFFVQIDEDNYEARIVKYNLTDETQEQLLSLPDEFVQEMVFDGNDLYLALANGVYRTNLDDTSALEELAAIIGNKGMAMKDGVIYYSNYTNCCDLSPIYSIDSEGNQELVLSDYMSPASIVFIGDDMYVAEFINGAISKTTIDDSLPVRETFASGYPFGALALSTDGTDLFFSGSLVSQQGDNEIFRLDIEEYLNSLSVDDYEHNIFKVYPNPTTDFITVQGLSQSTRYTIYNVVGSSVAQGAILDNSIDVSSFSNGMYFLTLNQGITLKFVKN